MAETSYVGLHLFCRMSKQIPPSAYTLGWNILDTNRTVGGLLGYSSVNSMVSLNVPSSKGVSCGPNITAFQIIILLSVGAPDTPVGGSSCRLCQTKHNEITMQSCLQIDTQTLKITQQYLGVFRLGYSYSEIFLSNTRKYLG